jgi:protein involved in polysaccharide export with SLBB domain
MLSPAGPAEIEIGSTFMPKGLLLLALLAALPACRSYDESRILQTLNQRGFGRKYVGDANEQLTLGIMDSFQLSDPNNPDIFGNYRIGMDGLVYDDLLKDVFVAGFTPEEIAQAFNLRYAEFFTDPDVRVKPGPVLSKRFYIRGEATSQGEQRLIRDTTVWDALMTGGIPRTADLSDIRVIRADPNHPLIILVDLEKMVDHGDSSDNIPIREDDIIVVQPNLAGMIRDAVGMILTPLQPVLLLAISVRNIQTIADSFQTDTNFFIGGRGGAFGGVGGRGGGVGGLGSQIDGSSTLVVPQGGSQPAGQ